MILLSQIQGAVFDLPEEIAKELLEKDVPEGNSLSMITKVLILASLSFYWLSLFIQHNMFFIIRPF